MRVLKPAESSPGGVDRVRRVLGILFACLIIVIWLVGAAVGGPYFGRVGEVSSNDQAAYLPSSADATRVQAALSDFRDSDTIPAVVILVGDAKLTKQQLSESRSALDELNDIPGVSAAVSPALPSEDGKALEAFVPIDTSADVGATVADARERLAAQVPRGVRAHVTGPAGFSADLSGAFSGIDGLLLGVALAAVFVILIIVYRSLLLPVAVLATSVSALTVALLVIWWLAREGVLLLSGQTQGILFILVIGAATDYSLLYVSRYREALRAHADARSATRRAVRGALEPILASGGTVIVGLLCLLLSDLKSNSALGPVAAIGIAFAVLSALTLLPAILLLAGRSAFWPVRPRFDPVAAGAAAEGGVPARGLWGRLGGLIARRPRTLWTVVCGLLVIGALGVPQLQAQGVAQSELVLTPADSRDGQDALSKHFPAGSGSPAYVLADRGRLQETADRIAAARGVQGVAVLSSDTDSGTAPITAKGITAFGPPGTPAPAPTVVAGRVMLQATLSDAADSAAAQATVRDLRAEFSGTDTLVGGVTAIAIDTQDASLRDRTVIIPVVLAVILVILMLLLRSVLAPVLLVLTTLLSFLTSLGVAAVVFNHVLHLPGADPAVPLFGFVFLVALGIDYNIFLATRVREETVHHGPRTGVLRGLAVTGGVITSAGLVLAATFGALAVLPILFLVQIAFIVAFGVLLDTFLVRAVLVPALFYDIGGPVWWPSRPGARKL